LINNLVVERGMCAVAYGIPTGRDTRRPAAEPPKGTYPKWALESSGRREAAICSSSR